MRHSSILKKTSKGLEEVEKRTHKLAGRLRAVLFMVDGQRTMAELLDQAGALAPQLEAQLEELSAQGFLIALGETNEPSPAKPVQQANNPATLPVVAPVSTQPPVAAATPLPSTPPTPAIDVTRLQADGAPSEPFAATAMAYATPLKEMLVSSELPAIDGVPQIKEKLVKYLTETMGMKAMFAVGQLNQCASRSEIESFVDDIARQVALTGGSKGGEKWRERARKLVGF
jgi:hypothetical protein